MYLSWTELYPAILLKWWNGTEGVACEMLGVPVVRASKLTEEVMEEDARFNTHCEVRRMLAGVWEREARPSM